MNWEAYDKLPPELQAAVDVELKNMNDLFGEEIPTRE